MDLKKFINTEISRCVIQPHYTVLQCDNVIETRKHLGQCLYVLDKNPQAYETANAVFKALHKEGDDCMIFIEDGNIKLYFYSDECKSHKVLIPLWDSFI